MEDEKSSPPPSPPKRPTRQRWASTTRLHGVFPPPRLNLDLRSVASAAASATARSSSPVAPAEVGAPSCQALKHAVSTLYRIDDFSREKIGAGFFSEVYKVTHKSTGKVMVLKMNKHRSNRNNMLKEVQLMNQLHHPNILRFEAACVHEGQLHALTEYINGGSLEQLIQMREEDLPWSVRMSLALDMAKGIAYLHSRGLFHRDLTSKNVLVKRSEQKDLTVVVGDFGLAAKIPKSTDHRLPQVGSPYWMSPECLKGKFYDQRADIFSMGIILCELIGRLDADPDTLPRTENFGVDYIAFSAMCPNCPPEFLKLTFTCVRIDPASRPSAKDMAFHLDNLLESQRRQEARNIIHFADGKVTLRKVGHRRSFSTDEDPSLDGRKRHRSRSSPSEKARFHFHYRVHLSALSVGKEMSLGDPHYRPRTAEQNLNPFATLPRLREGKRIVGGGGGDSSNLFSSCFELPSPSRGPTPTGTIVEEQDAAAPTFDYYYAYSLPPSPTRSEAAAEDDDDELTASAASAASASSSSATAGIAKSRSSGCRFEDHLFQGRVQLLRRLYSGGYSCLVTQDDSGLPSHSSLQSTRTASVGYFPLRRRGSCESGFFSSVSTAHTQTSSALPFGMSADDFFLDSELSSTRSLGSSLLTVSDLEEDLRAASLFLSSSASTSGATKRTSSVFTDSNDDLSSLAGASDEFGAAAALMTATSSSSVAARTRKDFGYEKDIRDIVEYFEATCVMEDASGRRGRESAKKQLLLAARAAAIQQQQQERQQQQQPLLPRSQNIDRLIKRVVEKESRERLRKTSMSVAAAAAATAGSSSVGLTGATAAPAQLCDGIVRSKLPIFDATKRPSLLMNHRAVMMRRQRERERGPHEDQKGFVKSKMAIFDGPTATTTKVAAAECASTKKMAERRLSELMNKSLEARK